jgi:hypothetical protein
MTPTLNELKAECYSLWALCCIHDGIDPQSDEGLFTTDNPYVDQYDDKVKQYQQRQREEKMKIGKELKPYWVLGRKGETLTEGYSLEIPWVKGEFAVTRKLEDDNYWVITEVTTGTTLQRITEDSPRKAANHLKAHYGPEHPCWDTFEQARRHLIEKHGERDRI